MKLRDPVCGMLIERTQAAGSTSYGPVTYYFCATACMDAFRTDPARYFHRAHTAGGLRVDAVDAPMSTQPPAAGRSCPYCGSAAHAVHEPAAFGELTLDESVAITRSEWRRRLGYEAYGRDHAGELIRSLLLCALAPAEPEHGAAARVHLAAAAAALANAPNAALHVKRELQALSDALWQVLATSGLPLDRVATHMAVIGRHLFPRR